MTMSNISEKRASKEEGQACKRAKATISNTFNPRYYESDFVNGFNRGFTTRIPFCDTPDKSQAYTLGYPFRAGALSNVFDEDFLKEVKKELLGDVFYHKSNDLYEFFQSEDLKLTKKPYLSALREAIYSPEFVQLMTRLTGIKLNSTIDLAGQRYSDKSFLLCHDDDVRNENEGRRIAFIIYLVPEDWCEEDGGLLSLYSTDLKDQPAEVIHSIVPKWNSVAFFQVGTTSFHEVTEILTASKDRISITGWFYGTNDDVSEDPSPEYQLLKSVPSQSIEQWINPQYLNDGANNQISDIFLEQSSVELQHFLRSDVYEQVEKAVSSASWTRQIGPAHARRFRRIDFENSPDSTILKSLEAFLQSEEFGQFLCKITNLELRHSSCETRVFGKSEYTMCNDQAIEKDGLDVVLSLINDEWKEEWGGATHYVAEEENLLTLWPTKNTLSLVLRDEETLRFVRYVNHHAELERREVSLIFTEN
ncbi:putative component of NuA3 histone acetyltransferase complex [Basidiobolus ranarum]|uniref:Component of NuA3 histone acetyltransferase complex n=1 Tax=Basidiobolus ranarum TaxID=34480 RepID=A0ABR2W7S2_9FUNG